MTDAHDKPLFRERQAFRQPWLWAIILVTTIPVVGLFLYGLYRQLYLGKPWGTNPSSDVGLGVISAFVLLIVIGFPLHFWLARLKVRVDATHVHIRFFPWLKRSIPIDRIVQAQACTYRPILEYGGWGWRYSLTGKGWAYNISGNRGVRLELTSGKRVLIGSQKAEALADAIHRAKSA